MNTLTPLRRSDPDVFEFDWADFLTEPWGIARRHTVGDIVQPTVSMGYYAECSVAGLTAAREPRWRAEEGAIVIDGSASWVMKHPDDVSLPTISAATYTIEPSGITQSNTAIDGSVTSVKLDATDASLGKYIITAEITAGGEDYSMASELEVTD